MSNPLSWPRRVVRFYVDGFRQMTWGRVLWAILIVKLLVFFVVLRLFFFQPVLGGLSDEEKADVVGKNLSFVEGEKNLSVVSCLLSVDFAADSPN